MPILTTQDRLQTTIAGKYRLDRVLGEGGMGVVYAGHHIKLDLPVAVKFLHPQYSRSPDVVERFLREARATSRLVHPNVVQVRDVDIAEDDGSVYMVLELLSGRSLADHIEREQVLSVDETLSIILPATDALVAAHGLGIVHRDIKPDNVFLSTGLDGKVVPKVLDFGIAKLAGGGSSPSATATGAVMGTALYMAPEQAMGRTREVGPVSDVWSAAVMTYECLTGGYPFDIELTPEMNAMAVMMSSITAPIVPLANKRPELSALSAVLARALEREPSKRTPTMQQFGDELRAAASGVTPEIKQTRVLSRPPPPRGDTTGPLQAPASSDPVAALAEASRMEREKRLSDSLAHTMLPQTSAPHVATPHAATPATDALGASQMIVPARSMTPYLIGAGGALIVAAIAIGAFAFSGTNEVTPAIAATPATPAPPVAEPVAPTAPATTAASTTAPTTTAPTVAEPVVAEVAAPEAPTAAADETDGASGRGRHREGHAGSRGRTETPTVASAPPDRASSEHTSPSGTAERPVERTTPPPETTTTHRAGGLSSSEF